MTILHPIIHDQLAQVLHEDYGLPWEEAFTGAKQLVRCLERRDLQVIKGEWIQPEVVYVDRSKPVTPATKIDDWNALASRFNPDRVERETGRTPWKP